MGNVYFLIFLETAYLLIYEIPDNNSVVMRTADQLELIKLEAVDTLWVLLKYVYRHTCKNCSHLTDFCRLFLIDHIFTENFVFIFMKWNFSSIPMRMFWNHQCYININVLIVPYLQTNLQIEMVPNTCKIVLPYLEVSFNICQKSCQNVRILFV